MKVAEQAGFRRWQRARPRVSTGCHLLLHRVLAGVRQQTGDRPRTGPDGNSAMMWRMLLEVQSALLAMS
jgi:hypothetical protein